MHLKKLELKNFRNYTGLNVEFLKNTILIFGDNGQGKTNLLESIYYLSSGKSHRTSNQDELIKWGTEFSLIRAEADSRLVELEFRAGNSLKIKVDRVMCRKKSEFISIIPAVLFTPDDLKIIKGSPSNRREFLDDLLERIYPGYQALRLQYQKILNQRNSLLKSIDSPAKAKENLTFEVWNENLAKHGSEIIKKRSDLVSEMRHNFCYYMKAFFPDFTSGIQYVYSWDRKLSDFQAASAESDRSGANGTVTPSADRTGENILKDSALSQEPSQNPVTEKDTKTDIAIIKQKFLEKLDENLPKEISYRTTVTGPHRDDFIVTFGEKDIRSFGSQGQQRAASVSLKFCELEEIREKTMKNPVLLLDDILSELDLKREKIVLDLIKDKYQTFITTSNINYVSHIEETGKDRVQELVVKENSISKK